MTPVGRLIVVSGPSGVGKGTVVAEARRRRPDLLLSVSATTRSPRPGEVDGVAYFFTDRARFNELVAEGQMLEHAEFAGNLYGTPRRPVMTALAAGSTVILEIDLAGARQVKSAMPESVTVFIAPPSMVELAARLRGRGTEDAAGMDRRLRVAEAEIAASGEFDVVLINTEINETATALLDLADPSRG